MATPSSKLCSTAPPAPTLPRGAIAVKQQNPIQHQIGEKAGALQHEMIARGLRNFAPMSIASGSRSKKATPIDRARAESQDQVQLVAQPERQQSAQQGCSRTPPAMARRARIAFFLRRGFPRAAAGGLYCRSSQKFGGIVSYDAYHKRKIGNHVLKPETQMMGYGYDPSLSEGSLKPPMFLTSTFVFKTAQDGKDFFDYTSGRREPTRASRPVSCIRVSTIPTSRCSRTGSRCGSRARRPRCSRAACRPFRRLSGRTCGRAM